jgi:hypothetical protein
MGGAPRFCKDEISVALCFLLLVPNAESIPIPEQDLEPIAIAIQEQEQVT